MSYILRDRYTRHSKAWARSIHLR